MEFSGMKAIRSFFDLPDALENNHNLRYQCLYRALPSKPLLPNFTSTSSTEKNVEVVLQELAQKGLEIRLKEVILKNITDPKQIEETKKIYVDRLNYEVKMINQMKFSGYFLIVSDYILWAKNNNIPVGPGRGSGAGSLVAWALSITELDPIKFGNCKKINKKN